MPTLDDQISAALIVLAVTLIGGIAGLIKVWFDQLAKKLAENTAITKQARDAASGAQQASNGQLSAAQQEAAQLRQKLQAVQARAETLADIVRYIQSRPEAAPLLAAYTDRRRVRVRDDGLEQLITEAQHAPTPPGGSHASPGA
jgi:uncharacterized membrane protein